MLTELRIENFAIIQDLELNFSSGLTTFTGETGAGKSIILDAIEALIGGRADATSIRSGAGKAVIEAVFRIPPANRGVVTSILEREELLDDPDEVSLSREIRREGRSVARVNGRSVSVSLLRELGAFLVDIHGQSEHLSLLNVRQHLNLLDRYAGTDALLEDYRQVYHRLTAVRRELEQLQRSERDAERRTDLLTFQVQEIESAHLQPEEEDDLRLERDRLANAESLAALVQQSTQLLEEGSPEAPAISDLLGEVVRAVRELARIDASRQALADQVELASDTLVELGRDLRDYQEQLEFNPRRLEQVEERLDLLHNLKRKYGGSIPAVLAFAQGARQELDTIAHASERIAALEEETRHILEDLARRAQGLSRRRAQAAQTLAQGVEKELMDLSMAGARFRVDLRYEPDPRGVRLEDGQQVAFNDSGIDRVEFLIAPNPGEGLKPLARIASGGETSRLMLALKNVLARADHVPTLIFDEIDQGISGRVGTMVGEKLWQLARRHQVLCVTHLPQLAAFGDQHYRVRKLVNAGRTTTRVDSLDDPARLDELALMMGNQSEANRSAAGETLQRARQRSAELTARE
ncbi:MAG: DNA repair protein RecN [Anaerolineaceae bacterium]|nr:DNA repair protein RecN [Anaerolineaceae bacterium]